MKLKRVLKHVHDVLPGHMDRWIRSGRPAPPPHSVKVRNLLVLADLFDIDVLVETGTYKGDMIAATLHRFDRIYSIEIDPRLAKAAQARFRRSDQKVSIVVGDSGKALPEIVRQLPDRALFWLDGHYSGKGTGKGEIDTPILAEIETIASLRKGRGDVVIVDDARLFGRLPAYPQLDDFVGILRAKLGGQVLVADDSIFALPKSEALSLEDRNGFRTPF
jgi:hypothetical protein